MFRSAQPVVGVVVVPTHRHSAFDVRRSDWTRLRKTELAYRLSPVKALRILRNKEIRDGRDYDDMVRRA